MYIFLTPIIIYAFLFIVTMMDKRKDKIEISIIRDNEEVAIKTFQDMNFFPFIIAHSAHGAYFICFSI